MVEILVGPIASGKSTYAKKRAKEGAIIINDDAIVNGLHGGFYTMYSKYLKKIYKTVENSIFMCALSLGLDVVVDRALDVTAKARRRWISLAQSMDEKVSAVVFLWAGFQYSPSEETIQKAAQEHGRRRFNSDSRGCTLDEWYTAAYRQIKAFEYPQPQEGFTSIWEYSGTKI